MADESATPSIETRRSRRRDALPAVIPLSDGPTPLLWALSPNCSQSVPPAPAPADVALPAVVVALVSLVAAVAAPAVRDDLVARDEPAVFPPHATAARANPATR